MKYINKNIVIALLLSVGLTACAQKKNLNKNNKKTMSIAFQQYQYRDYKESIKYCDRVLNKYPNNPTALELKAANYFALKKDKEGIVYLKKLVLVKKDYAKPLLQIGKAFLNLGEADSSLSYLSKYKKHPKAHKNLLRNAANYEYAANMIKKAKASGNVAKLINLGKNINTIYSEYFPGLTIDGKDFYFTRNLPNKGRGNENFFKSEFTEDGESLAMPLNNINTKHNEGSITVGANGKFVFFTSCGFRPNNQGSCDLYFSRLVNGTWTKPQNVGTPVNSSSWESQPSISSDGKTIYFSSGRPGGLGGKDIWKSTLGKNNRFGKPVNLGPKINTSADEQTPFIHADGRTLYFASRGRKGMGGSDLFVSKLDEFNKWGDAVNLGYPINSTGEDIGLIVERTGKWAYYSSERKNGFGGLDLYKFELPKKLRPEVVSYIKGVVSDKESGTKLVAKIDLIDLKSGKTVYTSLSDKNTGSFMTVLKSGSEYALNVDSKGYLFHSENFTMTQSSAEKPYKIIAELSKPKVGESMVLKNVFFNTNQYNLQKKSETELNKLVELLNRFPNIKVEISGHTDNVGNATANKTLSDNRANAVRLYLLKKGIDTQRLNSKGYGSNIPIANNNTVEGKALNRRTEMKIIGM